MSLLRTQSRFRPWPLKSDGTDAPLWTPLSTIAFRMNSIPLLTRGNLANYVPALALTAYGTFTTNGTLETSKRIRYEDLTYALYGSFDLQGAWHGRPLAAQHVRGATARLWEHISLGYQSGSRHQAGQRVSSAAEAFRHTIYLPLSHALGRNGARYTSQLALLYQDAHLEINTPANTQTAGNFPSGVSITLGPVNLRCSAILMPEPSLRLAPGVEWLELQQGGAAAGSDSVDLESLGMATALEGVEPGAGIDTMLALSFREGLAGSYLMSDLSRFSCPFTDCTQTQHLDPYVNMLEQVSSMGQRPRDGQVENGPSAAAPSDNGNLLDRSGFPYGYDDLANADYGNGGNGSKLPDSLLVFPIIISPPDLQVSKLQKFEGTSTYYRTIAAVQASTIDRTLVHQYKSWTPQKHEDFRQLLIASKLAAAVLGTVNIVPRAKRDDAGEPMSTDRARFFPVEYMDAAKVNTPAAAAKPAA
jgi:hypothetical protein